MSYQTAMNDLQEPIVTQDDMNLDIHYPPYQIEAEYSQAALARKRRRVYLKRQQREAIVGNIVLCVICMLTGVVLGVGL